MSDLRPIPPGRRAWLAPLVSVAGVLVIAAVGILLALPAIPSLHREIRLSDAPSYSPALLTPQSAPLASHPEAVGWIQEIPPPELDPEGLFSGTDDYLPESVPLSWPGVGPLAVYPADISAPPSPAAQPTPGQPIPGLPTPGQPSQGLPNPGQPTPGRPIEAGSADAGSAVAGSTAGGAGSPAPSQGRSTSQGPSVQRSFSPAPVPPPTHAPTHPDPAPAPPPTTRVGPDPCATMRDFRRGPCYQVLDDLAHR